MNRKSQAAPAPVSDVREFFSDELRKLMEKHQLSTAQDSFHYLVDLMVRHTESSQFFKTDDEGKLKNNILAEIYADYLQGDAEQKRVALRRLGDVCLMVTGFFPDSLNRKLIDIDYYFGMGGTAYWQLSNLQLTKLTRTLFKELSVKFKLFADVLSELSERTGLQSNSDLLRLYEKWLITGNDRLKGLLSEHGIQTPVKFDPKVRH